MKPNKKPPTRKQVIFDTMIAMPGTKDDFFWCQSIANALDEALSSDEKDAYIQELRDNLDHLRWQRDRARVKLSKFVIAVNDALDRHNVGGSAKDVAASITKMLVHITALQNEHADLVARNERQKFLIFRRDNTIDKLKTEVANNNSEIKRLNEAIERMKSFGMQSPSDDSEDDRG